MPYDGGYYFKNDVDLFNENLISVANRNIYFS